MISIAEKIISIGSTNQEISNKLNINPSTLSRFLSGKSEIKFESLFQLIQAIYDESEQPEVCHFYFKGLYNKRNIKCALEYFVSNKDWDGLMHLVNRERDSSNKEVKELLPMYEVLYRVFALNETINDAVKNSVVTSEVNTKEGVAVQKVMRLYSGKILKQYSFIYEGVDDALSSVEELENSYFKQSIKNRIYDLLIVASLHSNNIEEAEKYINNNIKQFTSYYLKANAYYFLAKIQSLNSFENAIMSLNNAIKLFRTLNFEQHVKNAEMRLLPFIYLYHKKDTVAFPALNHNKVLKAYFHFRQGDVKRASSLLDETLPNSDFYYYFVKGIIVDDISYIWMSLIKFINDKDNFSAKLPLQLLLEKGVNLEEIRSVFYINGKSLV